MPDVMTMIRKLALATALAALLCGSIMENTGIAAEKKKPQRNRSAKKEKGKAPEENTGGSPVPDAKSPSVVTVDSSTPGEEVQEKPKGKEDNPFAKVLRPEKAKRIRGLELQENDIPVGLDEANEAGATSYVLLPGRYGQKGGSLVAKGQILKIGEGGFFQLTIYATKPSIDLVAITPEGKAEVEKIIVVFPPAKAKAPRTLPTISVSLGSTILGYTETKKPNYSATALTFKTSLGHIIGATKRWDIDANLFFTVLNLSASQPEAAVRYVGTNFRVGYSLPMVPEPWGFKIGFGIYYTTMIVANNAFGYRHLLYPQLFPIGRRVFKNGGLVYLYFKFVPLGSQFGSFSERELAIGTGYRMGLARFKPGSELFDRGAATISLDLSELTFKPSSKITVGSSTASLSFGYSYSL